MRAGIKVGPETWKKILTQNYAPQVCEVWFRTDWVDRYREMFAYLKDLGIESGLHFWGILPGKIMPNFAFPDDKVRSQSLDLVKKTIDIAAEHNFRYVNIHPGSYTLSRIDFERQCMLPVEGKRVSRGTGDKILFENVKKLDDYARKKGVLLFTETIPAREPEHWRDLVKGRLKTQDFGNVPVATVEKLADEGFLVCNDFCHTAADEISDDKDYLFDRLYKKSKRLADQTKLLHINTMPPPFNGTDGHLGIRNQDFEENVFPSRKQLKKLLELFVVRDDVWAIPEPFSDHVANTRALERMIAEA